MPKTPRKMLVEGYLLINTQAVFNNTKATSLHAILERTAILDLPLAGFLGILFWIVHTIRQKICRFLHVEHNFSSPQVNAPEFPHELPNNFKCKALEK